MKKFLLLILVGFIFLTGCDKEETQLDQIIGLINGLI